jgi:RNA polymerase sigma factor (sigma-70 family)
MPMASVHLGAALRQIHGLFEAGTVAGLSDGQLLERYLARRDESAFAALVMRHGPMVLGVCHAILRGAPEVEDAFQATFLVLIRKAGTIRGRDAVGGWLHRVAHRVAVEAGRDRSRRDRRERGAGDLRDPIAADEGPGDDDWRIPLHEELARLPERLRQPMVLCYLEGKTHAQAALELRWSEATLRRRLADARGLLRARLTRRGAVLSSATLAAAMASHATAAVPPGWVDALTRAAAGPTASAAAVRLAGQVVRGMLAARARTLANVAALLVATGLVAGHLIPAGPARAGDPIRPAARSPSPTAPHSPPEKKTDMEPTIAIRGRVLAPDGKPFAGARIYAYPPHTARNSDVLFAPGPPAPDATSDAEGHFHFAIPDPGFDTLQARATWAHPTVAALAPGFGPGWTSFTTADEAKDLILKLVKDDVPIEGRILDLEGGPVPGVSVRPVGLFAAPDEDLTEWEQAMSRSKDISDGAMGKLSRFLELFRWSKDFTATTGADGKFRMTGIGRDRVVSLLIEGPTIATEFADVHARTRPGPTYQQAMQRDKPEFGTLVYYGATFDYAAAPSRPIEGTVRDKESGQPIAGVSIRSERFAGNEISGRDHVRTTTGPDGRYRLAGMPAGSGNRITAHPGPAQPYLGAGAEVPGGAGPGPATVDFVLKRGLAVRGKVTDKATGQPVPAIVEYFAFIDNPHRAEAWALHGAEVRTCPDGSFEVVGLPGRGLVAARAERDYYLIGHGADKIAGADERGSFRTFPHICHPQQQHAIVAINPAEDARSLTCDLALDPGMTLTGTVVGPDGQPVAGCTAIDLCPHTMSFNIVKLVSGTFSARALDPKRPRPLVFRHDEKKLTAVVVARGDEGGPLTVRLQPAGTVTGRLLDDDGQPRRGVRINDKYADGQFGPGDYFPFLRASIAEDGRFQVEGLIPGVAYNLGARGGDLSFFGDFATGLKLQPGETRDLGDVKVKERR